MFDVSRLRELTYLSTQRLEPEAPQGASSSRPDPVLTSLPFGNKDGSGRLLTSTSGHPCPVSDLCGSSICSRSRLPMDLFGPSIAR